MKLINLRFFASLLKQPTQRKHAGRWLFSLQKDYLLRNRQPWITFDAIDFLDSCELHGRQVFEYGSGGSTLYWLSKGAICVSVEHDRAWYHSVKNLLRDETRLDYRFIEPELDNEVLRHEKDFADPDNYISSQYGMDKCNYATYVRQIDDFQDQYFDLVFIDGRARPSCIKHGARKVKLNGLLVLDNAEREHYTQKTAAFLEGFECKSFYGAVPQTPILSNTNIYIRRVL